MDAKLLLINQKQYFREGKTLSLNARKEALIKLEKAITRNEERIYYALKEDLGKSRSEAYMCEVSMIKNEIHYMLRHLSCFMREKRVPTPLAQFASRSFERPCPYGAVLIVSPWNYPFLLTLEPLVDALAAGNTAILKPSAYAPKSAQVIEDMIKESFDEGLVTVVTGGREENKQLFSLDFNYIFFTGGAKVGQEVLKAAAEKLIPVSLELGGKSPCIVDESANIKLAARRIVFGKFINCGQTCVAPDYIYCHESVKHELISALKKEIKAQLGENPLENENYGKIINDKHYLRLLSLIDEDKLIFGGEAHGGRIAPTIMSNVNFDDAVMSQEIFGPILPVLSYTKLDDAIVAVQARPEPLALYIFSSDKGNIHRWKTEVSYGGGCINDTLIHLASNNLGFGGVGHSGMGSYHGKHGFDTFTHYKSIVDKKSFIDLPIRYQPYTKIKDWLVNKFV